MRQTGSIVELSATDLGQFLACRHRTGLDLAAATGVREGPHRTDPALDLLIERGILHERRYADALRAEGLAVVDIATIAAPQGAEAERETLAAMRAGADVVLQGALRDGRWGGRPDVLRRVEAATDLGAWGYEAYDTKLTRETRGGTILQLALYSEMVRVAQGRAPEQFHVVTPEGGARVLSHRVGDYEAYFRWVRARLEEAIALGWERITAERYPEPVEHCEVCRWWRHCDTRRRADDHLSFVAGISGLQRRELVAAGIGTLEALGGAGLPRGFAPSRGTARTYDRVQAQARVQLEGRRRRALVWERIAGEEERGLGRLPLPSAGDLFLDLEGDPFVAEGGREFLFGLSSRSGAGAGAGDEYSSWWAWTESEERAAFEAVVDFVMAAWARDPTMHVYHYAPYEPAAFKRLMGRHATREAEVDRMLRGGLFVDLYAVVRHGVRASVERYSIKDLEGLYGLVRPVALADAREALRAVERALELGAPDAIPAGVRAAVEGYNRDDCVSAARLRDWLEARRQEAVEAGVPLLRPAPAEAAPPEAVDERTRRAAELRARLLAGVAADRAARDAGAQARWVLGHLLDWHRREEKAPWWEYFRLRDLPVEDLAAERAAIVGLRWERRTGGTLKCPIDRYAYPPQETDVRPRDLLHVMAGEDFGEVEAIDRAARTVDVKKRATQADVHPTAVFAHTIFLAREQEAALARLAENIADRGLEARGDGAAARQLLMARAPRLLAGGAGLVARAASPSGAPGESPLAQALRVAGELDETVLAIQGPPGAGKTYTGARMIVALARAGRRVGVTAMSHKVIRNLLDAVDHAARAEGVTVRLAQKVQERSSAGAGPSAVLEVLDNAELLALLADGGASVGAGTSWLWSRAEARGALDVLFVDEAGQMSLADVLAVSQAARSLVLLGDPRQLEQPVQGSHPEGTAVSALEHLLQGRETIPTDRGIFLPETWRLAPELCTFTSDVFYEGRLASRAGLERQRLEGTAGLDGAGLWVAAVPHRGNQNTSREEVEAVARLVDALLQDGARRFDASGAAHPLTGRDLLVVAPYNAHVALLEERLAPRGVRAGTVDRFQGQEAAVVIYSMATSSPEEAPRGMEFLYSLNRLNVATSRARCAAILVASPQLFAPECRTPRQMKLANALCRYLELARVTRAATDEPSGRSAGT